MIMAIVRVWHSGSSTDPRDGAWANAATSLQDALTHGTEPVQAGDTILVASDHAKTYAAATTLTFPGNNRVVSVDRADDTFAVGGTEKTTTDSHTLTVNWATTLANPSLSFEGLTFSLEQTTSGDDITLGNSLSYGFLRLRKCTLKVYGYCAVTLGVDKQGLMGLLFDECTFDGGSSAVHSTFFETRSAHSRITLRKCVFQNMGSRNRLVYPYWATYTYKCLIRAYDCDLSMFDTLMYQANWVNEGGLLVVDRCKLKSGYALLYSTVRAGQRVCVQHSAVGTISATPLALVKLQELSSSGSTAEVDTANYRAGSDGENNYAIKVVTNTTVNITSPFQLIVPLAIRHDASASKTLKLFFGSSASDLEDDDLHLYIFSGAEGGSPTGKGRLICTLPTFGNQAAAGTSTYLKTDGSSWTGSGAANKYRFEVSGINPVEPAVVEVLIWVNRPSITLYFCPKLEWS